VVEAGQARERLIEVAHDDATHAWVRTGVHAGDRIVRRPGTLRDGDPVTVDVTGGGS
jgi:alpha-D-ribose 1-methylphosphonate 5-triphosphate diphosphatase PhnM